MPTPTMIALPNLQALFASVATGRPPARLFPATTAEVRPDAPGGFETILAAAMPPATSPAASEPGPGPEPAISTPLPVLMPESPIPAQMPAGLSALLAAPPHAQKTKIPNPPTPLPSNPRLPTEIDDRTLKGAMQSLAGGRQPTKAWDRNTDSDLPIIGPSASLDSSPSMPAILEPKPSVSGAHRPEIIELEVPTPSLLPGNARPPDDKLLPRNTAGPREPAPVRSLHIQNRHVVLPSTERKSSRQEEALPEPLYQIANVEPTPIIPPSIPTALPRGAENQKIGSHSEPEVAMSLPASTNLVRAETPVDMAPTKHEQRHPAARTDPMPTPQPVPPDVPLAPTSTQVKPLPSRPGPTETVPPAEQLAPVLVSASHDDTTNSRHITLQLQPDALGRLQIQIDRAPNQPMQIRIEAERPETLTLLQRDTPQLQHALDRAGVARDALTVTFHAAAPVAPVPTAQDNGQPSMQFLSTGLPQQSFGGGRQPPAPLPEFEPGEIASFPSEDAALAITARSGLDIVA